MIDAIDQRLSDWIQDVLGLGPVTLTPPGVREGETGVSLYLLELADAPPPRTTERTPLQLSLRYLVTTWAPEPAEAHRILGELALAVMEHPELDLDLTPLPPGIWTAFGLAPQPSVILRAPLRKERPERPAPYVREPLVVQAAPGQSLAGRVVGPHDIPVAQATVEIPGLGVHTRTDGQGRFIFANIPADPPVRLLRVRAKGRVLDITLERGTTEQEPLIVRLDSLMERER